MLRRDFIKTTALGAVASGLAGIASFQKTHILTLSWDDGFKKSFYETADIFEKFNLKACLNVIASGHFTDFKTPDKYQKYERGNFKDWNTLQKRGHEIMPHTWEHQNLTKIPFEEAKNLIDKCLEYFEENLEGYQSSEAVYNFAYNASNPELENHVLSKVRALRSDSGLILGEKKANPFPAENNSKRLGCQSFGPDNADKWVNDTVNNFLNSNGGWLILNLHGLDNEGWGPVSSTFLNDFLKRMLEIETLDILATGEALKKYIG